VRAPLTDPDPDWNEVRREQFLLRTDVTRPASIDRMVWGLPEGKPATTIGAPLPWVTIDEVRTKADALGLGAIAVVIGVVVADTAEEDEVTKLTGIEAELAVHATWEFLGFDVADGSISGLSNCGYQNDEASALRPAWTPRLNDHGLFQDVVDAAAFRDLTNARVPEHAPFFVYGLWVVPS
jgi:hypothetical protein